MGIIYRMISYSDPAIGQVEELYTSAFPADERRDFSDFTELLSRGAFSVLGAFDASCGGDKLLAFITFWKLDGITYLEHFAVVPQMRGRGLGRKVFTHFLGNVASTIVLEVEPPVTLIAVRRIRFYESLGLKLWDGVPYVQPPYGPGRQPLELKLMTHGEVSQGLLEGSVAQIHCRVYGCASAE